MDALFSVDIVVADFALVSLAPQGVERLPQVHVHVVVDHEVGSEGGEADDVVIAAAQVLDNLGNDPLVPGLLHEQCFVTEDADRECDVHHSPASQQVAAHAFQHGVQQVFLHRHIAVVQILHESMVFTELLVIPFFYFFNS